jgi:hypothetical protein
MLLIIIRTQTYEVYYIFTLSIFHVRSGRGQMRTHNLSGKNLHTVNNDVTIRLAFGT